MTTGENWKEFVPKVVAEYLEQINAIERLEAIFTNEEKQ